MFTITSAFTLKCPPSLRSILTKTNMEPRLIARSFSSRSSSCSPTREDNRLEIDRSITLQDWQGWGTTSAIPSMVTEIVEEMKVMEVDMDDQMTFGGKGGKLQGDFKVHEDKKHRAKYKSLSDSESKLKFFSARQIACRLLGSKGYLCQKCWLPSEDCMCSKIVPSSLWQGMRFWLYMHPKDFLRQNNTGKLLWQIFGVQAATLCIYGISEHEEIMWNAFKHAGKTRVWCLYPNKNASAKSVQDIIFHGQPKDSESLHSKTNGDEPLHFILIDGTWNNSAAMFKRLKEKAELVWGEDDLPCISLTQLGTSAMHKLRPQPSWDRTCTAAAAIGLLSEMHLESKLSSYELDKQAEALEDGLEVLLEALTSRRLRKGRSIKRRERHISQFGSGCMWR